MAGMLSDEHVSTVVQLQSLQHSVHIDIKHQFSELDFFSSLQIFVDYAKSMNVL